MSALRVSNEPSKDKTQEEPFNFSKASQGLESSVSLGGLFSDFGGI